MKTNTILLLLTLFVLWSCNSNNSDSKSSEEIKSNLNMMLNDWHLAATNANFDNYFNTMDSIAVFIGTDASENWTKKEFATFSKPYFDRGKAWDFKTLERNIYLSENKNVAWFDELLNTWMGTCRGSGVLEKTNSKWKIKQCWIVDFLIFTCSILKIYISNFINWKIWR